MMQAKISKTKNKVKDCACETSLVEVLFLPGNGSRKLLDGL
jgi:hypothetical protein